MNEIDEKLKLAIVGALDAMPSREILDACETHARRRVIVVEKFLARYAELIQSLTVICNYLPQEVVGNIAQRARQLNTTIEEVGECMQDSGEDVLKIGGGYYNVLGELRKAFD